MNILDVYHIAHIHERRFLDQGLMAVVYGDMAYELTKNNEHWHIKAMERGSLYYESNFDNEYDACIDFLKPLGFYSKDGLMNIFDHEEDSWYFLDKQNIFYFYVLSKNKKHDLAIMLNQRDIEMYRQQGRQALIQIYEKLQLMSQDFKSFSEEYEPISLTLYLEIRGAVNEQIMQREKNKAERKAFEKLYEACEKSQTQLDNTYEMVSTLTISTPEQPKYESTIKIWIQKNFYIIMIFFGALMALWSHL